MKPRRPASGERSDSTVVLAALLGIIIGSAASLWTQRASAVPACALREACPVCTACPAVAGRAGAVAVLADATQPVGGTWRPAGREREGNAELQKVLQSVAINDEVLVAGAYRRAWGNAGAAGGSRWPPPCCAQTHVCFRCAVSNSALITPDGKYGMLATWVESVQHAGVKNFMVIALDEQTGARAVTAARGVGCRGRGGLTSRRALHTLSTLAAGAMQQIGVACWRAATAELADKAQDNHGISAQKFHLLREFLSLGYRVLLSGASRFAAGFLRYAAAATGRVLSALTPAVAARRGHCDAAKPVQLLGARLGCGGSVRRV
jgi:hypothetical protein